MGWAEGELEHVGRITAVENPDVQYSYAQSTVNGMLHLRDALLEMVTDPAFTDKKEEIQRVHDQVVRAIKHLIKDYDVNIDDIKKFNTRGVLGSLNYLKNNATRGNATRRNAQLGARRRRRTMRGGY